MAEKIVLATHNAGKIREFKSILEPLGYEAVSVHDVIADITEPEETGTTFAENALLKATYYMKATGLPCLADDSGLEVAALGGAPGVRSARYAGEPSDTAANNALLLKNLTGVANRRANFTCAIALVAPDGTERTVEGKCFGAIADAPSGAAGFGYDPLFVPDGFTRSFAELSADEKNAISHRGRALAAAKAIL